MRLRHADFKRAGKQALQPHGIESAPEPVPPYEAKPMRMALKAKRARTGSIEDRASTVPISPVPNLQQNATVAHTPGVSLSSWMPPAANNNTPQSLRMHPITDTVVEDKPDNSMRDESSAAPVREVDRRALHGLASTGRYGDDILGYGSELEDVEAFTDVEDEVLGGLATLPPVSINSSAILSWAARFSANSSEVTTST